jgi:hypothetical protein
VWFFLLSFIYDIYSCDRHLHFLWTVNDLRVVHFCGIWRLLWILRSASPSISSLTVITWTVRVVYTTVFEYKNQVMFQYDCFWRWTSLSNWSLLLVSKQKHRFWNTKSKSYFNMTLFEGSLGVRLKSCLLLWYLTSFMNSQIHDNINLTVI